MRKKFFFHFRTCRIFDVYVLPHFKPAMKFLTFLISFRTPEDVSSFRLQNLAMREQLPDDIERPLITTEEKYAFGHVVCRIFFNRRIRRGSAKAKVMYIVANHTYNSRRIIFIICRSIFEYPYRQFRTYHTNLLVSEAT